MRLPEAYRSLARPSSALEPSHPPYGVTAATKRVTQLASRLRMQPTVIGSRAEARLTPWADPQLLSASAWGPIVNLPEEGLNVRARLPSARRLPAGGRGGI